MFTGMGVHNSSGVRHEGTAEGQLYTSTKSMITDQILLVCQSENIGEIECYTATPSEDFPNDKVLLFLADGFGINLINSKVRLSTSPDIKAWP